MRVADRVERSSKFSGKAPARGWAASPAWAKTPVKAPERHRSGKGPAKPIPYVDQIHPERRSVQANLTLLVSQGRCCWAPRDGRVGSCHFRGGQKKL